MPKKLILLTSGAYLAIVLLLYSPVLKAFFVSDDFDWLWRAKTLSPMQMLTTNVDGTRVDSIYRPLVNLSFWADYHVWGLNPAGYHLVNVLLLVLSAVLVCVIVGRLTERDDTESLVQAYSLNHASSSVLIGTSKVQTTSLNQRSGLNQRSTFVLAFLSGLIFLILPNHPEAVSWISGRGDVLVAFFYLLAVYLFILFQQSHGERGRGRLPAFGGSPGPTSDNSDCRTAPRIVRGYLPVFAASLLSATLALLSKEMALTLSAVILLYQLIWIVPQAKNKIKAIIASVLYTLPYVVLTATYLIARWMTTRTAYGYYANNQLHFSFIGSLQTLYTSFVSNFLSDHWRISLSALLGQHWLITILISILIFLALIKFLPHYRRLTLFCSLFFVLCSLPIVYLRFSSLTNEGERFAYLPSVAIAILIAIVLSNILKYSQIFSNILFKMAASALIIIVLGFFSINLFIKNTYWQQSSQFSRDLLSNFNQVIKDYPNQGIVILGMPDNINGAQIWRNGWITALKFYYPAYQPDILITKAGLNLTPEDINNDYAEWSSLTDGYRGTGSEYLFTGPKSLSSADYSMTIQPYNKLVSSGSAVEIRFTPQFFDQMKSKEISFFIVKNAEFTPLALPDKAVGIRYLTDF